MKKGFIASALMVLMSASLAHAQAAMLDYGRPAPPFPAAAKLGIPEPIPSIGAPEDYGVGRANTGTPLRFWVNAEYLLWWTKGGSGPPLVTTGPALPLSPSPGSLGAPGTTVLFGADDHNRNPFSGGRLTLGFWCSDCLGAELSFFMLGQQANDFNASTSGAPGSGVLARPFFNTLTGMQDAQLVGYPGLAAGSISVHSTSGLLGAEGNMLYNLCRSCNTSCETCCGPVKGYRVDLLAGLRYMQLREGLGIAESTQVSPTALAFAGDNISAFDQFDTLNRFYGGQLGIRSECWWNRLFVSATGKVALGDTHQTVDINGATRVTTAGGATTVLPGNFFALPSNIGHYSRDQFSVVPELGLNVGYQVTRNVRLFAGYTLIYWTNVERPGDALNPRINPTRVPTSTVAPTGPLDPQFGFRNSNFWGQGVNAGIQLRF